MTERTPKLQWLALHDPIPEMRLKDFTRLMTEGFGLLVEISPKGKNYLVRLSDKPHIQGSELRSILVPTHHKAGIFVSPLCIIQVLAKFDKSQDDFRKTYNRFVSQKVS